MTVETPDEPGPVPRTVESEDQATRRVRRQRLRLVLVAAGAVALTLALTEARRMFTDRDEHRAQAEAPPPEAPAAHLDAQGRLHFDPKSPQLGQLRIEAVEDSPLPATSRLPGRLSYDENATARVFSPVAGRVVQVVAEAGKAVRAGDVLARIDSPELGTVESDLDKAMADERQKRSALERARLLYRGEVAPRKDLESAEAEYAQAQAETRRARQRSTNLRAQRDDKGQFSLRAPVDGVVADRAITPGLEVRPDNPNPLFTVTDPSRVWLLLDLPERLLGSVHVGQPVQFEVNAFPDVRFIGRTAVIGATLDAATHRVQLRVDVSDAERRLRPEMFARVSILEDGARRGIAVPNTALLIDGPNAFVFVEAAPGVFERRRVDTGLADDRQTWLTAGLKPGERVVFEGALLLSAEISSNAK